MDAAPDENGALFVVEAGHIMCFARAIGEENPAYHGAMAASGAVVAPPTFLRASAQYDPNYALRPRPGAPWLGSGRTATGMALEESGHDGGLHAEQTFTFERPIRAGDVLRAVGRVGNTWEKQGRRGGKLQFVESVIEYRQLDGPLVATATTVDVVIERLDSLDEPGDGNGDGS